MDPMFRVDAHCYTCHKPTVRFRGSPAHDTHPDIPCGPEKGAACVDLVVVKANKRDGRSRIVANFILVGENRKVHLARVKAIAQSSFEQPIQIVSVTKSADGSKPLVCTDIARYRCPDCVHDSRIKRGQKLVAARAMRVRRVAMQWHKRARRSKLVSSQTYINTLPDSERFTPCRKCCGPVEVFTNLTTKLVHIGADVVTPSQVYHKSCSPRCQICYECPLFPSKCACDRAKQRRCSGCKKWNNKFRMLPCKVPKTEACPAGIDYVCGTCSVACSTCKSAMPPAEHKKWSRCYPCAVAARRKRAADEAHAAKRRKVENGGGGNGTCACGQEIDTRYTECYACKHLD